MTNFNVVHILTFADGGAGRAALQLHQSLTNAGVNSICLCRNCEKTNNKCFQIDPIKVNITKKILNKLNIAPSEYYKMFKFYNNFPYSKHEIFTFSRTDYKLHTHPLIIKADIVHLHWVSNFLDYPIFFSNINKPIVWTLHDRNPFLGGFHYGIDLKNSCSKFLKLNEKQRIIKRNAIHKTKNIVLATPSKWMKESSEQSEIFSGYRHEHIPNAINTDIFRSMSKIESRKIFNINQHDKVILFVEGNKYKGFNILKNSAKQILNQQITYIIVGDRAAEHKELPFIFTGRISNDELMAKAYNAADVYVAPTLEDNFPNTILESMACGTPVIGSNVGGVPDIVREEITGMLFETGNSKDLADKIENFFALPEDKRKRMSENCRSIAEEEYSPEVQAKSYINLYNEILEVLE